MIRSMVVLLVAFIAAVSTQACERRNPPGGIRGIGRYARAFVQSCRISTHIDVTRNALRTLEKPIWNFSVLAEQDRGQISSARAEPEGRLTRRPELSRSSESSRLRGLRPISGAPTSIARAPRG